MSTEDEQAVRRHDSDDLESGSDDRSEDSSGRGNQVRALRSEDSAGGGSQLSDDDDVSEEPAPGSPDPAPRSQELDAEAKRESLMEEVRRASQDFKKLMKGGDADSEDESPAPSTTDRMKKQDADSEDESPTPAKTDSRKKQDRANEADLQELSVEELIAKALSVGITDEELDEAEEAEEPKLAIIDLILDAQSDLDADSEDEPKQDKVPVKQDKDQAREKAATKIQAVHRGNKARESVKAKSKAKSKAASRNPMLKAKAAEKQREEKEARERTERKKQIQAQIRKEGFDGIPSAGAARMEKVKSERAEREARRIAKEKAKAKAKRLARQKTPLRPSERQRREEAQAPPPIVEGQGLLITIAQAKDLRNTDGGDREGEGGKSDPFCTCQIPRKPKSKIETPVIMNDLNPVWNYMRQIVEYDEHDSLKFVVWEKDLSHKQMLGTCDLKFAQYHPGGFDGWIQMPTRTPGARAPELMVKVEILGPPSPLKSDKDAAKKVEKKKSVPEIRYEFGRRVPHKGAPLSPRSEKRYDAKRMVRSFGCWSEGLRGEDESTKLVPSKVVKKSASKKTAVEPPPEAEIALSTFKYFLLQRAGNYSRAWRIFLDRDWSGTLTLTELGEQCRLHGYHGNLNALWKALDRNKRGWCTLADVDTDTAELLGRLYMALETRRKVEEQGRRGFGHARLDAEEPESEPGQGYTRKKDDGMRLMKCLDVDATRRLTKGEFCCALSVLKLAKEEDGPILFDMLCHASAAPTPSSAVVTEDELQWLHNVFQPFNLFEKPSRHGEKISDKAEKKAPQLLSKSDRVEASSVIETRGRLRKVWSHDPAVFSRLYDDFERREDDYFERVTQEQIITRDIGTYEEIEEVSTRLYEDAFIRSAKRDLEAEGYYYIPGVKRPMDPKIQARLTAGKTEPKKTKRQQAVEEATRLQEQKTPKKKANMDRINNMIKDYQDKTSARQRRLEERQKEKERKEEEEREKAYEFKPTRNSIDLGMPPEILNALSEEEYERMKAKKKRHMLAEKQIARMQNKLKEEVEDEGFEFTVPDEETTMGKRNLIFSINKAVDKFKALKNKVQGAKGNEDDEIRNVRKSLVLAGLEDKLSQQEKDARASAYALRELAQSMRPQAPLPIPRRDGKVEVVVEVRDRDEEISYPTARTPRWIARNEIRRARSAISRARSEGRESSQESKKESRKRETEQLHEEQIQRLSTPGPLRLPEGPTVSIKDIMGALPLTTEDDGPWAKSDPKAWLKNPVKVFPVAKDMEHVPLPIDPFDRGRESGETPHRTNTPGASATPVQYPASPPTYADAKARGKGFFDNPQKPFRPEDHAPVEPVARGPVSREELLSGRSRSTTPKKKKSLTPRKSKRSLTPRMSDQSSAVVHQSSAADGQAQSGNPTADAASASRATASRGRDSVRAKTPPGRISTPPQRQSIPDRGATPPPAKKGSGGSGPKGSGSSDGAPSGQGATPPHAKKGSVSSGSS